MDFFKSLQRSRSTFSNKEEHQWIYTDPIISEGFQILSQYFSQSKQATEFFNKVLFLKVDGSFACAIDSKKKFVLLYPELISILKGSERMNAVAIIAHEMGHLVLDHQNRDITNLQAQIEADIFAAELGLGKFLLRFLKQRTMGHQIQQRIMALEKFSRREI